MTEQSMTELPETEALAAAMRDLERDAARFGSAMTAALRGAALEGRAFDDVLRGLGRRLADMALDSALAPLENAASGLFSGLASGLAGGLAGAVGGAPTGGAVSAPAPITFNVSTPDAPSFQRSAGQISAMVARSTARGRRSL